MRGIPFTVTTLLCLSFASNSAGQNVSSAGQQVANPTQEVAKEQAEGPRLAVGPARIRLGGYLGVTGIYRSTNSGGGGDQLRVHSVRGHGPGERERSTAQRAVVEDLASRGRRLSRAGHTFPPASGYFEMDFGGSDAGRRGRDEHECGVPPPAGFRRGSVRRDVLPRRRSSLLADDARRKTSSRSGHRTSNCHRPSTPTTWPG